MPERVAAALKQHLERSNYIGADDLVSAIPRPAPLRRIEDEEAL